MATTLSNPRVIENDAIVVLCLRDLEDSMTHHEFRVRAAVRGYTLSRSQAHNMLHRALGRVGYSDKFQWRLTAAGLAYREEVLNQLNMLVRLEREKSATGS